MLRRSRSLLLVALLGSVLLGSTPVRAQLVAEPKTLEVQLQREQETDRTVTITNTGSETARYCLSFDRPLQREATGDTVSASRLALSAVGAACGEVGELLHRTDEETIVISWSLNGVAMTPDGRLFASDFSSTQRTHEFTQELEVIRSFDHPSVTELAPFPTTAGLAYDPGGAGGTGTLWWLNREELAQELFRVLLIEGYAWGDTAGVETGRRIEIPPLQDADGNEVKPQALSLDPATGRFYFTGVARPDETQTSLWAVDTTGAIGGTATVVPGYPVVEQAYGTKAAIAVGPDAFGGQEPDGAPGEAEAVRIETVIAVRGTGGIADRLVVLAPDGADTGIETPLPDLSDGGFGGFTGEVVRSRVDPNGVVYYPFFNSATDGIVAVRPHPVPPSWLSVSAWGGELAPGESAEVVLTFSSGERAVDSRYEAVLQVFEAESGAVTEVPLVFEVVRFVNAEEDGADAPEAARLSLYPNPATGRATVALDVPETTPVRLAVYDVLGRAVAMLADGPFPAGEHTFALDTSGWPSGVYLVRLAAGGAVQTQRVTVLR